MPDAPAQQKDPVVLVFVYNADGGLFNTLTDIAHKALSPQTYRCRLCALTHGHVGMRREWKAFLESLDVRCEFLHRDEFVQRYAIRGARLPAVYRKTDDGLTLCLDEREIAACRGLDDLKRALRTACAQARREEP